MPCRGKRGRIRHMSVKEQIVHTHWLYGKGENKILEFKHAVREETNCNECFHRIVCTRDEEKRCVNFEFGRSDAKTSCERCSHYFTRYDKTKVPCFYCKEFVQK